MIIVLCFQKSFIWNSCKSYISVKVKLCQYTTQMIGVKSFLRIILDNLCWCNSVALKKCNILFQLPFFSQLMFTHHFLDFDLSFKVLKSPTFSYLSWNKVESDYMHVLNVNLSETQAALGHISTAMHAHLFLEINAKKRWYHLLCIYNDVT